MDNNNNTMYQDITSKMWMNKIIHNITHTVIQCTTHTHTNNHNSNHNNKSIVIIIITITHTYYYVLIL